MCLFCDIVEKKVFSRIVYENDQVLAMLDINPLSKGHTVILPKKHFDSLLESDEETVLACTKASHLLSKHLCEKLGADGCNLLVNSHECAGQTIPHMHFHVIPRYKNDEVVVLQPSSLELNLDEVLEEVRC